MNRKFVLVAGLALFEPGSVTQLMLAQLVCFAYVVVVVNYAPYKKDDADFANQAGLVCSAPTPQIPAPRRKTHLGRLQPGDSNPLTLYMHACMHACCRCCAVLVQAANCQIMLSLLSAMALKTNRPLPGSIESIFFGKASALPTAHQCRGPPSLVVSPPNTNGAHSLACTLVLCDQNSC